WEEGLPVRPDELRVAGCGTQLRLRCGEMVEIVQGCVRELRGSRPERPVDCRYQLSADDEIDHKRGDDHRERNGRGGNERETCAEAHRPGSRRGEIAREAGHGSP